MVRIGILQRMYNLSDEAVIDVIAVNRAYEYFCHLSPVDKIPEPSSLCKFRKMRLDETTMDEIMAEIVRQMIEKGIIKKESGIITGMTVQPGNYRDGDQFKELLDKTKEAGIKPSAAFGDKAYCRPDILEETKKLGASAYIPISHSAYHINEKLFSYNKDSDTWTCINGNESGTGKLHGKGKKLQLKYRFERECCRNCPHRQKCLGKASTIAKILSVGMNNSELYEHSQFTKSEEYLEQYKIRSRIEPKNSEMKRFHGLDRANGYGLQSVLLQAFFTAIAVNLKRMVALKG